MGNDPVNFYDPSGLNLQGVATGCFVTLDGVCDPSAPVDPCGVQASWDGSFLPGEDPCVSHQPIHSRDRNPPPVKKPKQSHCSIQLWERPVPFEKSSAEHTYLLVTDITGVTVTVEGGTRFSVRPPGDRETIHRLLRLRRCRAGRRQRVEV